MEKRTSRTKIGAVLLGIAAILATLGGWFSGTIETLVAIEVLIAEIGGVYLLFGFRGLPFVNRTK